MSPFVSFLYLVCDLSSPRWSFPCIYCVCITVVHTGTSDGMHRRRNTRARSQVRVEEPLMNLPVFFRPPVCVVGRVSRRRGKRGRATGWRKTRTDRNGTRLDPLPRIGRKGRESAHREMRVLGIQIACEISLGILFYFTCEKIKNRNMIILRVSSLKYFDMLRNMHWGINVE